MMKVQRRALFPIIAGAILAGSLVAEAQSGKVPRIGVLLYAAEPMPGQSSRPLEAFRGGLRDLGYVEGRNVTVEYRWVGGSNQRAAELAAELVRLDVAAIISTGTPATQAARATTATIPIVMTAVVTWKADVFRFLDEHLRRR